MKSGFLLCGLLLFLGSFITSPGLAGTPGEDRWDQLVQEGWTQVALGVLQRNQEGRIETFTMGSEGFAWLAEELEGRRKSLLEEHGVRALEPEIARLQEYAENLKPSGTSALTSCPFSYSIHANAYPSPGVEGARADADASLNNGCAADETYAYAYATATLNGTTTTVTQTDPSSGSSVSSLATASAAGNSDCYSYALGMVTSVNEQISYSVATESFACVGISVNDVSVNEGNSGTTPATFTVSLSSASSSTITVTVQTADGTATAPSDYGAVPAVPATVLTFTPGQITKTVQIAVNGDFLNEGNETFFVNLTNATNAAIAKAQGVVTIVDDDPVRISINDVSQNEGNAGTSPMTFTVSLSNPSTSTVTVTYQTANNTATAPSDYVALPATVLTFNPNQPTTQTINVTINGDTTSEPNETFFVTLTNPTNATIARTPGVGTIVNDDAPNINLPSDISVTEGDAEAPTPDPTFTVTLSNAASQTVTVTYATANGTALAGLDYTAVSGTLIFNPGVTQQSFTVPFVRDKRTEQTEKFFVNFSNPVGAILPTDTQVDVTVLDDDNNYVLYNGADATTIPGCFDMADVFFEKGAVYQSKPFSLTHKLDMTFAVSFGKYDNGGGGMVWVLAPSYMLGNDDMGYGYTSPNVGVEMDTVNNYFNDPVEDHVAVDENGGTALHSGFPPVQASPTSANIEDNLEHELRITRDPAINRLDVYFDGSLRLSYQKDIVSQIFGGNPTVYWGFTGANNCNDSVCPNNLLYWCPVALCIGDTATQHALVSDVQVSEGNTGNQTATFKVKLYCPRNEVVTVNWATANGTATAGLDYLAASGTLVFNPGETQKTVAVTVYPDPTTEPDETFMLNLSGASVNLATPDPQAVATIIDDVRFGFGQAGDVPLLGDWNGDGIDTPGVYRNGTFYLRNSNTAGPADIQFNFGSSTDVPVVGDWNGDGIDTVGIWNELFFYLKTANTASAGTINVYLGQSGDRPLAGDWNGDGIDTVGIRRGTTFILSNTSAGGWDVVFNFGLATDVPVMGDWNNDNVDTVGVFRDGTYLLRNSNTAGAANVVLNYGVFQDVPLAGDIDGDGDDAVGYFRNGTFALRK
jgi:Calx-beta domain-containing protein/lectin family protein